MKFISKNSETNVVEPGDLIITDKEEHFMFASNPDSDYQYALISLDTFEVHDEYYEGYIAEIAVGVNIEGAGRVLNIIKRNSLTLSY